MVGDPTNERLQTDDFSLEGCIEHFPANVEKFVPRRADRYIRCDRPEMMRCPVFDGSKKQRRFGPEPGIKRALGNIRGVRDPLHAGTFHAMGDELLERHIKDMSAQ